jgi:cell shape-determining protein MreC
MDFLAIGTMLSGIAGISAFFYAVIHGRKNSTSIDVTNRALDATLDEVEELRERVISTERKAQRAMEAADRCEQEKAEALEREAELLQRLELLEAS